MRCAGARRLLLARFDGELPPARERGLQSHLAECASCRAELRRLETYREAVRSFPRLAVPPDFDRKVGERIVRGREPRQLLPAALPALAACLCVFPLLLRALPGVLPSVAMELDAPEQIYSPGGAKGGGDPKAAAVERAVRQSVRSAGGKMIGVPRRIDANGILEIEIEISRGGVGRLLAEFGRLGFRTAGETQAKGSGGILRVLGVPIRLRLKVRIAGVTP